MREFFTMLLLVVITGTALWIILRPLVVLLAPIKPVFKVVFGLLFGLLALIFTGLLSGAKALHELSRRA